MLLYRLLEGLSLAYIYGDIRNSSFWEIIIIIIINAETLIITIIVKS